jgi:hypothetical protein
MEFTLNSCSSKCPRTPIYSLGVRMSVRQNFPWSRPDGGPWTSGRTTLRQDFSENSAEKSFLYKNIVRTVAHPPQVISISGFVRPDHGAGASGRLNFSMQFPYLMRVCPDHEGETSGRLKSNRQLPYTMHQRSDHSCQAFGRSNSNCDSCLMDTRVRTGYHIFRTVD